MRVSYNLQKSDSTHNKCNQTHGDTRAISKTSEEHRCTSWWSYRINTCTRGTRSTWSAVWGSSWVDSWNGGTWDDHGWWIDRAWDGDSGWWARVWNGGGYDDTKLVTPWKVLINMIGMTEMNGWVETVLEICPIETLWKTAGTETTRMETIVLVEA